MHYDEIILSIIIPTYNRPEKLESCLCSLNELDYPHHKFEVIVVDDGSTNFGVEPIVNQSFGLNLKIIRQENAGPATARNTGAENAIGQFLLFVDDDCVVDVDWLSVMATNLVLHPDCIVGGHTRNALLNNIYATTSQLLIDFLYTNYIHDTDQPHFFTTNNMGISKHHFGQLDGFDMTFRHAAGEDREFCARWIQSEKRLEYVESAIVYHHHNMSLRSFWQQHVTYGRAAAHFRDVYKRKYKKKVKFESLTFYSTLLLYPFKQHTDDGFFQNSIYALLLVVSQIANVFGFLTEYFVNEKS